MEQFIAALANGEAGVGFLIFKICYKIFGGYTDQNRNQILEKIHGHVWTGNYEEIKGPHHGFDGDAPLSCAVP